VADCRRRRYRSNVAAVHPKSEQVLLSSLIAPAAKLRLHSGAKRVNMMRQLEKIGQIEPIVINSRSVIVHGNARVAAARELGWTHIAAVRVEHLTDEDLRLYAIAANRLTLDAEWDLSQVRLELEALEAAVPSIDLSLSGFSIPEIDTMRGAYEASSSNDLVDDLPARDEAGPAISQLGDLWHLGEHRLLCENALDAAALARLMGEDLACMMFTDPPYNVPIAGHVSGKGKIQHREFDMAVGEMDQVGFTAFLKQALEASALHLANGGLAYVCMDHAHIGELIDAGASTFAERKSICVWDKGSGGMGSLYRNAHELVAVFKKGAAPHINNVALGKHGRNRTTIWRYPGVAQLGKGRAKALSMHPTVKPVALVADAILDASKRGGIILDPFGGSGTTLIAAHIKGRRARLMELDAIYVDIIIQRFEALTSIPATLADTGMSFAEVRAQRVGATLQPHQTADGV
jgi:DNA modification methylase